VFDDVEDEDIHDASMLEAGIVSTFQYFELMKEVPRSLF